MCSRDDPALTDDGASTDVCSEIAKADLPWPVMLGCLRPAHDTRTALDRGYPALEVLCKAKVHTGLDFLYENHDTRQ